MLWGYIYFSQLQLDSLLNSELKGSFNDTAKESVSEDSIIIVNTKLNSVLQLNQPALAAGIRLNMGMATAASLAHDLKVLPYQEGIEKQSLNYVVECLYDLVSDIAPDWPDGVFIRFGNMLKLYQNLSGLTEALLARLTELSFVYFYASAHTPLAAKILAKSRVNEFFNDELTTKKALLSLPVKKAFPDEYEHLERLGIKTLKQLIAIPFAELNKRLSPSLLKRTLQLQGKVELPLNFYQPRPSFTHEMELLYEISRAETLIKPLCYLLKKLDRFLHIRAMASQVITIDFRYRSGEGFSYDIHSSELCDSAHKWQRLIELKLERLEVSEPIVAIALCCQQLTLKNADTQDLFKQSRAALSPLELINLLQAKLDRDKVTQPVLENEHRPEFSSTVKQITAQSALDKVKVAIDEQLINLRPCYMLPAPIPLKEKVEIVHGPERIETAWWQQTVVRDYFIARNNQGQWCWVFRNHQHQWFTHGYFG